MWRLSGRAQYFFSSHSRLLFPNYWHLSTCHVVVDLSSSVDSQLKGKNWMPINPGENSAILTSVRTREPDHTCWRHCSALRLSAQNATKVISLALKPALQYPPQWRPFTPRNLSPVIEHRKERYCHLWSGHCEISKRKAEVEFNVKTCELRS